MPRQPRRHFPGLSLHVIQRGTGGATIFRDDDDYGTFLDLLKQVPSDGVAVHSFSLMKTHFHVIATPSDDEAFSVAMRRLGTAYVSYFNHRNGRFGALWAGRPRAKPIADETYWYTCIRYVLLNPVAAKVVDCPEAYRWSSYRAHACGEQLDWLTPHPLYLALGSSDATRQAAFRAMFRDPVDASEIRRARLLREIVPVAAEQR